MSLTHIPNPSKSFAVDLAPEGFHDVAIRSPPSFSGDPQCFRTCLQSSGRLSREEKICLMECYQKGSFHRPQSMLL